MASKTPDMKATATKLVKGLVAEFRPVRGSKERPIRADYIVKGRDGVAAAIVILNKANLRVQLRYAVDGKLVQAATDGFPTKLGANGAGDKSWPGGALLATEDNLAQARKVIEAAVAASPDKPVDKLVGKPVDKPKSASRKARAS